LVEDFDLDPVETREVRVEQDPLSAQKNDRCFDVLDGDWRITHGEVFGWRLVAVAASLRSQFVISENYDAVMKLRRVAAVVVLAASCGGSSTQGGSGGMGGGATGGGTGSGGAGVAGSSGAAGSGVAGAHGGAGGGAGARGGASGSGGTGGTSGSGGATGSGGRITCPSSSVPTCSFTACGGDLTGTWTIDGACYAPTHSILVDTLGCDYVEGTGVTITESGTWTFGSDLTYTRSVTAQTTLQFNLPYTCDISATDCSNVQVLDYAATCTGTGCCSCTQVRDPETTTDSGTYALSGATVNVTTTGGNAVPWQYCVNGNTLTIFYNGGGPETITAHR
jgi:hypothetical protein